MLELNSVQYNMARILKKYHINSSMYTLVANSGVDNTRRSCNLTGKVTCPREKKNKNQNAPKIVDQNYVSDQNDGNDQNYVALL